MWDIWVPGALTLIFGLLPSLQGVSANEAVHKCDILSCPKGFICCGIACCPERKNWNSTNDPFMIVFIIACIIFPLLCICGLVRRFCPNCRAQHHDVRTGNQQTSPEPPSIAPLENIWVTSLDPPPPYSQVVLKATPTEPPPPYSLRPEGPAGQMTGTGYDTL
ncbi:transmembrane protein 92-like [Apodemus sylvaticus]|uniref:transmembrane protein 92-like n=1 Tax=Apodemus sylvaticus TaxID=10129 RepID=UPI002242A443|nr:transmembrane protein 92-like [Apodemus sylvaticus]